MLGLLKNKNIEIIGIHGKAGSGKDYFAEHVLKDYFVISNADHFKLEYVGKQIFTFEEVFDTKPPEVRKALQLKGTEEGRNVFGEDIWVNILEAQINIINRRNKIRKFVIPDVRMDNEAIWVRDNGGIVIAIESNRVHSNMNSEAKAHSSEAGISNNLINLIVNNNIGTSIESLKEQFYKRS